MIREERKYIGQACYICLSSKTELVGADENIHIPLSVTEYKILSFFIDHANTPVYLEELAQHIWGANYHADKRDPDSLKSHISRVRDKLEKIRTGLRKCIDTNYGLRSYTLKIDESTHGQTLNIVPTESNSTTESNINVQATPDSLPRILTRPSYYLDERDVLHREKDIEQLVLQLSQGKETLLISGFGGIGKTSLARVLYSKLANKFDCIGWIEYIEDIRTSILTSFEICNEIENQEYRWRVISNILKNSSKSTLLFIDNVDLDLAKNQDPLSDKLLYEISGYPNLSIVVTSRLDELRGYHSYPIEYLPPEGCEDLFYFYYNRNEYTQPRELRMQRDAVQRLITRADYHTFAIELLAKSAKRVSTLDKFVEKIYSIGFRFPSRKITTNYNDLELDAANQLRNLFNMNTRSTIEQNLLWDVSVLPNTVLSFDEMQEWLGYNENDVDRLIMEGWLSFQNDGVYMHPLIKEVIHFDLIKGKAPYGTTEKLMDLLGNGCFFDENDSFNVFNRKFEVSNSAVGFINLSANMTNIMQYMGKAAQKIGKVSAAITYFRKVLDGYLTTETVAFDSPSDALATAYNDLGYQLSYTSGGRIEAEHFLKKALVIRKALYAENPSLYAESFATTCDYLGYLLSDNIDSIYEGEELLRKALTIRENLAALHSGHYIHDTAWTRDNLGFLLSMIREKYDEAEWQLREALHVRKLLEAESPGKYLTEVAWTCSNLAFLLQVKDDPTEEAEELYLEANHALMLADDKMPGVHMADIANNYNNMAVLLSVDKARYAKSIELLKKARVALEELEKESHGLYSGEIAAVINNLAVVTSLRSDSITTAERLFLNAIKIYSTLGDTQSDVRKKGMLEIIYNLGLFYYLKGDYQNAIKQFYIVFNESLSYDLVHKLSEVNLHSDYLEVLYELFSISEISELATKKSENDISIDIITNTNKILSGSKFIMYVLSGSRSIRVTPLIELDSSFW